TPAIDSGAFGDVYLTFDAVGSSGGVSGAQAASLPAGAIAVGVIVEPLIDWIWAGGLLVGVGGLLALWPGGRRRPTDPVTERVPEASDRTDAGGADSTPGPDRDALGGAGGS